MTIEQIREKILIDDDFVLAELRQLQYLYGLQRVIRSNLTRSEVIETNSVAEHIYALNVLANYFSELENLRSRLDMLHVHNLILFHDIDEIETGDIVAFLKTEQDKKKATDAMSDVLSKSPVLLQNQINDAVTEYKAQETLAAQFVKALDKIEPIFYFLNENGKKVFSVSPATKKQHCQIKEPYIQNFPYIKRFHEVTLPIFERERYFSDTW